MSRDCRGVVEGICRREGMSRDCRGTVEGMSRARERRGNVEGLYRFCSFLHDFMLPGSIEIFSACALIFEDFESVCGSFS